MQIEDITLPKDLKVSKWYYQDVIKVLKTGAVVGYYNSTFKPEQTITRAEIHSAFKRVFELSKMDVNNFKDLTGSEWFLK